MLRFVHLSPKPPIKSELAAELSALARPCFACTTGWSEALRSSQSEYFAADPKTGIQAGRDAAPVLYDHPVGCNRDCRCSGGQPKRDVYSRAYGP